MRRPVSRLAPQPQGGFSLFAPCNLKRNAQTGRTVNGRGRTAAAVCGLKASGRRGQAASGWWMEGARRLDFAEFFARAFGGPHRAAPYAYQSALAERLEEIDILFAPTGLGKTAAVTLAWAWRRATSPATMPRRLIWCLPMRTLVEQTKAEAQRWMDRLCGAFGDEKSPAVHMLMGGAVDDYWRLNPERHAIIVGTQDLLISRALMRGYGMSRFGWPIDYGLLHTDALWVFDEVQLMGASLATSAQLEGFRRRWAELRPRSMRVERWPAPAPQPARSLWVSATLRPDWLAFAEFAPDPSRMLDWKDYDAGSPQASKRFKAGKRLHKAESSLTGDVNAYAKSVAREALSMHQPGTTTLVIVNTVGRAQAIARAIESSAPAQARLLLHSRFRPGERLEVARRLAAGDDADRIVVATQAIEAGVDISSAAMLSELAPLSSMIQRFGRCNRAGERNDLGGSEIRWIDVASDKHAAPYAPADLNHARDALKALGHDASPAALEALVDQLQRPANGQVIRPKDFEELFDTDADLSGFDLDISPYVREGDEISVHLFWRDWAEGEEQNEQPPRREELCPAPVREVQAWLNKGKEQAKAFIENPVAENDAAGRWRAIDATTRLRPGQVVMLAAEVGGYTAGMGFDPAGAAPVADLRRTAEDDGVASSDTAPGAVTGEDLGSRVTRREVLLEEHLGNVAREAQAIGGALKLPDDVVEALHRAAAWHDVGKAHKAFRIVMGLPENEPPPPLAKSTSRSSGKPVRRHFRHELASALAFLNQHDGEPNADLVAFLIAAHHGKVRMGLRALPGERPDKGAPQSARIARGVQDDDVLPAVTLPGERSEPTVLSLGLMALGEQAGRPSWVARTQRLLADHGPFRLAYLEALVRMADWRASAAEQAQGGGDA